MGEGVGECEIKGCKEHMKRAIVNMDERDYVGDNTMCSDNEPIFLCDKHANHLWRLFKTEVEAHDAREINDGVD